jgi:hypothetical protein
VTLYIHSSILLFSASSKKFFSELTIACIRKSVGTKVPVTRARKGPVFLKQGPSHVVRRTYIYFFF